MPANKTADTRPAESLDLTAPVAPPTPPKQQGLKVEQLIDEALASGDSAVMREALAELKRMQSPFLNWAGKAERTSFAVDTVSLHVHERIDPLSILSALQKAVGRASARRVGLKSDLPSKTFQFGLFNAPFENLPLRDAVDSLVLECAA